MEGFSVTHCANGKSGYEVFKDDIFQLIILDVMLPYMDGFTLAESIRKDNSRVPIVFLTAKSMKEDKIKGFKIGADDYITKPFSTEEFILRINAVLRRSSSAPAQSTDIHLFNFGAFEFNYGEQTLTFNQHTRYLTRREAEVLRMLCQHRNRLLKREVALKEIWGENDYFMGRSMDVYIAKLRKMLKEDPSISIINVHNTGFKLVVEGDN